MGSCVSRGFAEAVAQLLHPRECILIPLVPWGAEVWKRVPECLHEHVPP